MRWLSGNCERVNDLGKCITILERDKSLTGRQLTVNLKLDQYTWFCMFLQPHWAHTRLRIGIN